MSYEIEVLRAVLRLSRRRSPANLEQLVLRVGGNSSTVRAALRSLAEADLVVRSADEQERGGGARLTMSGLAVALAVRSVASSRRAQVKAVPADITRRRSRAA